MELFVVRNNQNQHIHLSLSQRTESAGEKAKKWHMEPFLYSQWISFVHLVGLKITFYEVTIRIRM